MIEAALYPFNGVVPAGAAWAGRIMAGQSLRIVDVRGRQAVDFLCYNAKDIEERYSAPNTLKAAATLSLTRGHLLYSDLANPMFEIVEDTFGGHDTTRLAVAVAPRATECFTVSRTVGDAEKISWMLLPCLDWEGATSFPT